MDNFFYWIHNRLLLECISNRRDKKRTNCSIQQNSKSSFFLSYDKTFLGDFLTRIVSDINEISNFLVLTKPSIYLNLLQLALILTVLFLFSWQLSVVVLATIPFYYLILTKCSKSFQKSSSEERQEYSKVMETLRENNRRHKYCKNTY